LLKKTKILMMLLCVVLCIGVAYSANAASQLSAKQLLLNKLQSSAPDLETELNNTSSGSASFKVNKLSGTLVSDVEPLEKLAGAKLKLDYELNSPEKKFGADYDLVVNKNAFKGNLFIDDNKLISTTEILALIKETDPDFRDIDVKDLPQYVYFTDNELVKMWDALINSKGQGILPEFKELLIYVVEAVPEKYFTTSLGNHKVSFSLDKQGMEDVIFSVLQKIKNEKERFATLAANFVAASDPTQDPEKIKMAILMALEESIQNGDFPDTPAEVQKLAKAITLEELTYEISLLPSGHSRFIMTVNFDGNLDLTGRIKVDAHFTGGKKNSSGTYKVNVTAQGKQKNVKVNGQLNGKVTQTGVNTKENDLIKLNVTDFSGTNTLLDLDLQANAKARVDKNVNVNIPVLNETNSVNIEQFIKDSPKVDSFFERVRLLISMLPC